MQFGPAVLEIFCRGLQKLHFEKNAILFQIKQTIHLFNIHDNKIPHISQLNQLSKS